MKKIVLYLQNNQMDCGPTCIQMIAKYYGKTISINHLRNNSEYNKEGVTILGISQAAEKVGFKSLAVRISFHQLLEEASFPCILHWNQNHFVVLYKVTKKTFTIADPAKGIIKLSREEFKQNWISTKTNNEQKGVALLLEPTATFYQQKNEVEKKIGWGLLLKYVLKYKAQIVQLFLGLLLGSVLQLVFPFLTQSIVDTGIVGSPFLVQFKNRIFYSFQSV